MAVSWWSRSGRVVALVTSALLVTGVSPALALTASPSLRQTAFLENRYFSPNADGFEDVYQATATYTEPATVSVTIENSTGALVHSASGSTLADSDNSFPVTWDGMLDGSGGAAPEGEYALTLSASGTSGGSVVSTLTVGLTRAAAPSLAITAPAAATTLRAGDKVRVAISGLPGDRLGGTDLLQQGSGISLGSSYGWETWDDHTASLTEVTPADVADGPVDLVARVTWYDALWGSHEQLTGARSYTYASAATLTTTASPRYYFPNYQPSAYESFESATLPLVLGRHASLTTDLVDSSDHVVRVFRNAESTSAGKTWEYFALRVSDDPASALLPNGRYTFRAHAAFVGGGSADVTIALGVDDGVPAVALTAPAPGTLAGPTTATVTATGGVLVSDASAYTPSADDSTYLGGTSYQPTPAASQSFRIDPSPLSDGEHEVVVYTTTVDPLGWERYLTTAPVAYTVDAALTVTGDDAPADLTIDNDPDHAALTTRYTVSREATVTTTVQDVDGATVATLEESVAADRGLERRVAWDGTDSTGAPVAEATYRLVVHADSGGRTAELSRSVTLTRTTAGTLAADRTGRVDGQVHLTFSPSAAAAGAYYYSLYEQGSPYPLASLYEEYDTDYQPTGVIGTVLDTAQFDNGSHALYVKTSDGLQSPRLPLTFANPVHVGALGDPVTFHPQDPTDATWPSYGYLSADQPADLTVTVRDSTGGLVRELTDSRPTRGYHDLSWDGRDAAGAYVPDGTYAVSVTASEDVVPSTDTQTASVVVATRDIGRVSSPDPDVVIGETLHLVYQSKPDLDVTSVTFRSVDNEVAQTATEQPDGTWTADVDTSQLTDGRRQVYAAVSWNDSRYEYGGTKVVPVVVRQPKLVTAVRGTRSFSPNGDDYEDDLSQVVRLARPADLTVTYAPQGGSVLASQTLSDLPAGDTFLTWDGAGASPGPWVMHVHAVDSGAGAHDVDVPIVVMGAPGALAVSSTTQDQPSTFTWTPAAGTTTEGAQLFRTKRGSSTREYAGDLVLRGDTWQLVVDPADQTEQRCTYGYSYVCTTRSVDLPNGTWDYTVDVAWTDAAGVARSGNRSYSSPTVAVTTMVAPRVITPMPTGYVGTHGTEPATTFSSSDLRTSQPTAVRVVVTNSAGDTVASLGPFAVDKDSSDPITWPATDLADGTYTLSVIATEPVSGKTGVSSSSVVVRRAPLGAFTAPDEDEVVAGTISGTWRAAPGVDVVNVQFADSTDFGAGTPVRSGADWTADDIDTAGLGDGPNTALRALVTWKDSAGINHRYVDVVHVDVQQAPRVPDLPPTTWFTPNGDGLEDTYRARFGTSARGLLLDATVEKTGGTVVRTLASGKRTNGQNGDACEAVSGGYRCDELTWDGHDDAGAEVPDGSYTLRVVVRNVAGEPAEATTVVGVERRLPVSTSLREGVRVADTLPITYTPVAGFSGTPTGVTVGVSGVLSAQTAVEQSDGTFTTTFDLRSSLPDTMSFLTVGTWRDETGAQHETRSAVTVAVDRDTLDLVASMPARSGYDPFAARFTVDVVHAPADNGPVTWTVDPGDGSDVLSGTITAPYAAVIVEHTYPVANGTPYPAVVAVTDSSGHRRHEPFSVTVRETPPVRPVVTLSVTPAKGIAPVDATATLEATTTDGSALTYTLAWGDGSSTEVAPINGKVTVQHQYGEPSTDPRGYLVQATVTATRRATSTQTYQDARVVVGKDEPLAAHSRDGDHPVVSVNGQAVTFDGTGSSPAAGIDDYAWDFGDGASADDATTEHAFSTPGVYLVTLTVSKGAETKTTSQTVRVLDKQSTSVSTVTVTDGGAGALPGAVVVYRSPEGESTRVSTGADGTATLYGLPDGDTTVDVYAPDHTPSVFLVTVTDKVGSGSIALPRGPLGEATVSTTRIPADLAASKYGVDLDSDQNKIYNEYTVELHYYGQDGEQTLRVRGAFSKDGSEGKPAFEDPDGNVPDDCLHKDDLGNDHYICREGGVGGSAIQTSVEPDRAEQRPHARRDGRQGQGWPAQGVLRRRPHRQEPGRRRLLGHAGEPPGDAGLRPQGTVARGPHHQGAERHAVARHAPAAG